MTIRERLVAVLERAVLRAMPGWDIGGGQLALSVRLALGRVLAMTFAGCLGGYGVGQVGNEDRSALAGACVAWSISILVWALSTFGARVAKIEAELRSSAQFDLLHARLNLISSRLELRPLNIDEELDAAVQARVERLAHYAMLEEFAGDGWLEGGAEFWTTDAMGIT